MAKSKTAGAATIGKATTKPAVSGQVRVAMLDSRIDTVLESMLNDLEVTPAQFSVSEVARRAGCSRQTLITKGVSAQIAKLAVQKCEQQVFSAKMTQSRKPKVKLLEDSDRRLRDELEALTARHDQVVSKLARVLNNVRHHAQKLGATAEQVMSEIEGTPLEPMTHRVLAFGKRKD